MLFGVPTMYHRLAADLEATPRWPRRSAGARLLVSGLGGAAGAPTTSGSRAASGQRSSSATG